MRSVRWVVLFVLAGAFPCAAAAEEPYALLVVESAGGGGMVSAAVDVEGLIACLPQAGTISWPRTVRAVLEQGQKLTPLVSQYDGGGTEAGRLTVRLPQGVGAGSRVRLYFSGGGAPGVAGGEGLTLSLRQEEGRVIVGNGHAEVVHDPKVQSGLPSRVTVTKTGKVFEGFIINDRVHDPKLGSFVLRGDGEAKVRVVRNGPLEAVVEVRGRYLQGDKATATGASAVYEFAYRAGSPAIEVTGRCEQQGDFRWSELHLMEWNFPARPFPQWAAGDPRKSGRFEKDGEESLGSRWGCLSDGANVVGISGDSVRLYSGTPHYGSYVHGPWVDWGGKRETLRCTVWLDGEAGTVDRLAALAAVGAASVRVSTPEMEKLREDVIRQTNALAAGPQRGLHRWLFGMTEMNCRQGAAVGDTRKALSAQAELLKRGAPADQIVPAIQAAAGGRTILVSESAGLMIGDAGEGCSPLSLFSLIEERELLSGRVEPLWTFDATDKKGTGYQWTNLSKDFAGQVSREGGRTVLTWQGSGAAAKLAATVDVALAGRQVALKLAIRNDSDDLSIRRVWFPEVFLRAIGQSAEDDTFLTPVVSGVLTPAPLVKGLDCNALYPGGWGAMQFGAYWDKDCGLYYGAHDPVASTKRFQARGGAQGRQLEVRIEWPAADATRAGNDFEHPGNVTLATFTGDWYDAAQICRAWVEKEAKWWPRPADWDRPDTPAWMKEVCVWALASGSRAEVVGPVKKFAEFMGVPTAVHWYNWHEIPFDNNYPHYFPTKPEFAAGVAELQKAGVRVMPYINGRLWDSDTDDFKSVALPATTKKPDGSYYIEHYGAKPQDLVPMCPTQAVWQNKVSEIVLRLLSPECNVDGVYIDQVAAAWPVECFDASHGHPLGGGCWWTTKGYWPMLEALNKAVDAKYPDKMLTTECNAEPFTQVFDGYLTWHFQNQNMVPVFAAIYGGKIQMFSRSYNGEDQLAHRMRMAQSLVFGEQLGWIGPNIVEKQPTTGEYLRRCGRMRHRLLKYLSWGRMARPPKVSGEIPQVTADWAWGGPNHLITDSALQANAWRAEDGSVAFLFANSTDKPVSFTWHFDGQTYGLTSASLQARRVDENQESAAEAVQSKFERAMTLKPLAVEAVVLRVP